MRTILTAVLLNVLALLALSLPPAARAEISFSVSPIRIDMAGEPGGSYTDAIEVNNEGKEKVRIKVAMQDWYLSEEGTPIFRKAGSQPHSCIPWLRINPVDFLLQPGEKKTVRYSVAIPAGTPAGGYWAAFVFETVPHVEPGQKSRAVAIKGNIAAIVYVTAGKPVPEAEFLDLAYAPAGEMGAISMRLQNKGNVQFRLKGSVAINARGGKTVQTLAIPDAPVLAGFTRTLSLPLKEKLPAGSYTAVATVDVGGAALLAGEAPFTVK
ncbi:hypothetical protein [Geobacter sp.]|uniref:hypothetical protein n=1 Tax=Geobacter sp. TaxID=46610 RepID=UPI002631991B|nr:hypothetical protein [Geobacter sp.]